MNRITVWALIVFVLLVIGWLAKGSQFALFLDRFVRMRAVSLPVVPMKYDGGGIRMGEFLMTFASTNYLRSDHMLVTDSSNRVILSTDHGSFTLGQRT